MSDEEQATGGAELEAAEEALPQSAKQRLAQNQSGLYTSDLSVNEFMLVRDAGFDPVIVGDLSTAREFDVGSPVYVQLLTAKELREKLGLKDGH